MIDFTSFLELNTNNKPLCFNSYKGIKKSDYPKWQGWKILNELKTENKPLESDFLDLLVYNFYLCKYIYFISVN